MYADRWSPNKAKPTQVTVECNGLVPHDVVRQLEMLPEVTGVTVNHTTLTIGINPDMFLDDQNIKRVIGPYTALPWDGTFGY